MTFIKGYSLLMIFVVAAFVFSLTHLFLGEQNTIEKKVITESNILRERFNIPIIEHNWIKDKKAIDWERWGDGIRGINSSDPIHLYKEISYKSGQIEEEKDAFHFDYSDSVQYRLVMYHHYLQNPPAPRRIKCDLIIYESGKFPPSHSRTLQSQEADSVLHAWKISI